MLDKPQNSELKWIIIWKKKKKKYIYMVQRNYFKNLPTLNFFKSNLKLFAGKDQEILFLIFYSFFLKCTVVKNTAPSYSCCFLSQHT